MNRSEYLPQIPYGTKDLLPDDAQRKRIAETRLAELFSRWGYEEVITPTFEYLETFAAGGEGAAGLFKFFDRNSRALTLRPDMTTPIARLAATRMKEQAEPLRLFYLANVFRHEEAQAGRQCEFYQAGVELMGAAGPAADAEVVALAVEALREAGLKTFQISIGQVDYINGLMEACELTGEQRQAIQNKMVDRDLVGLEELLTQTRLSESERQAISRIPLLHGKEELLKQARTFASNTLSSGSIDNLAEIYELLRSYKVEQHVRFDLGIIRDFGYYTGMVFEGYTPGLGFPVCGGGRYDKMLAAMGMDRPATGFALGIERVVLALERQGLTMVPPPVGVYIGWESAHLPEAVEAASFLRREGQTVELAPTPSTRAEAAQAALLRRRERFEFFGV